MTQHITLWAGKMALSHIRDAGLSPDAVKVVAGAAGGPKWLILAQLDRALFGRWFSGRTQPLFFIGSSIGSWRFAAASHKDPLSAIDRLEDAYIHQTYDRRPTPADVTREGEKILNRLMGDAGEMEILSHPSFRLNFMAVRSKGPAGSETKRLLVPGLLAAALLNAASRRLLKFFFDRTLFHDSRNLPPFYGMNQFPIHRIKLTPANLRPALMASGAIPLVMSGITSIPGAPIGVYRDGGVIDYHLDIPFLADANGIVLYPHYTRRIIPGWLDKHLPWRRPHAAHLDNVLLITPSRKFLARLPYGKIPDRNDFYRFQGQDKERIAYWKTAADRGRELAEEFMECVDGKKLRNRVRPIEELPGF